MLENLLESQRKLPKDEDARKSSFTCSAGLWMHLKNEYPDILHRIMEIEDEYNKKEMGRESTFATITNLKIGPYQNEEWVISHSHIDNDWFKNVRKINNVRNTAAHSYKPDLVYKILGFNGETAFEKSKEFCLNLISKMFYISINE